MHREVNLPNREFRGNNPWHRRSVRFFVVLIHGWKVYILGSCIRWLLQ